MPIEAIIKELQDYKEQKMLIDNILSRIIQKCDETKSNKIEDEHYEGKVKQITICFTEEYIEDMRKIIKERTLDIENELINEG